MVTHDSHYAHCADRTLNLLDGRVVGTDIRAEPSGTEIGHRTQAAAMRTLRSWDWRLAGLFHKRRSDPEISQELESHLQLHVDANTAAE